MAYLHDERGDEDYSDSNDRPSRSRERELTLSTGTILAVFFGLALSWGAFFAFGYNMGSKTKTSATATAAPSEGDPSAQANFSNFKPSSGTPAIQPVPGYMSPKEAAAANKNAAAISAYNPSSTNIDASLVMPPPGVPHGGSFSMPTPNGHDQGTMPAQGATVAVAGAPKPTAEYTASAAPQPGSFMVQVAAVTHQEDADVEMTSLRRKGYAVVARTEPADRFIHIQVGPFSNKKDAEAMRQRLIGDGFLAIVK